MKVFIRKTLEHLGVKRNTNKNNMKNDLRIRCELQLVVSGWDLEVLFCESGDGYHETGYCFRPNGYSFFKDKSAQWSQLSTWEEGTLVLPTVQ